MQSFQLTAKPTFLTWWLPGQDGRMYLCRLFSCPISIHLTLFSIWSLPYFH